ncbi:hypothetical protein CLV62_104118 [Dysgonomonas alginatilytica]|uniref:Uncharacterized protein n=1 Tax=Dysgonomonas alginatilytica TaxID=1605892 RepID=A0A2V3PR48_9BACT|nr:hypothetical protein [Dysgonomonas alginatilytica]PXV66857.1 hypothetical protein CLV62_104118 [Dysgonomonas alginatilytica]
MKPVKTKLITSDKKIKYTNHLGSFVSQAEAERYAVLLEMQAKGLISDLQRRVSFTLIEAVKVYKYERVVLKTKTKTRKKKVTAESPVTFEANFTYRNKHGKLRVEVVRTDKEYKDPTYIIKRKLMRYLHNIVIIENKLTLMRNI